MLMSDEKKITEYRIHTMRLSYEAQDRRDLSCESTSLLRAMKASHKSNWGSSKRVGRYLRGAL
eukprot:2148612-Heterocapsa_arctica.AAC.1